MTHPTDTYRLDFDCGCWLVIVASEEYTGRLLAGLSCCAKHDGPSQNIATVINSGAQLRSATFRAGENAPQEET